MLSRGEIRAISKETTYEVPTTAYWRGVMARARRELSLTQAELADLVGTTQPTVSAIEAGTQAQSRHVPAICAALSIPLPFILVEDEWDERWVDVGRVLRRRRLPLFLKWLELIELDAGLEEVDS